MTESRTNMHFRKYDRMGQIRPKGGLSLAILVRGNEAHVAIAQCGRKDLFNRKLGRTIAEGRLNSAMEEGAEIHVVEMLPKNVFRVKIPEAVNLKSFIAEQPFVKQRVAKLLAGGK